MGTAALQLQGSLFAAAETPAFDREFAGRRRHELDHRAWIDHQPEWLAGADAVFDAVVESAGWRQREMQMYGEMVAQPRLTAFWDLADTPDEIAVVHEMGQMLSGRYGVEFTRVGCNLYRDGDDSVAWHGDRVARDLPTATIAIVSLGARRPFRFRPADGGPSRGFELGRGDLLVMGGSFQRTWRHTVPKLRRPVGPRISVTYRHAYDV
ncbi:MAG: alpha-ketoglutarate-dependent dioxygenase AlkB [Nitriliruptorales bacterium]|nr:alpha-ketoglutarate-dependent dioxygenase AlkB [Nitriliruptorales bacterium]